MQDHQQHRQERQYAGDKMKSHSWKIHAFINNSGVSGKKGFVFCPKFMIWLFFFSEKAFRVKVRALLPRRL